MTWLALLCSALAFAAAPEWKPLFNGKDLNGWEHVGPGRFTVENGALKSQGGMGLLYWKGGKIGDSVIRVVFKTAGKHDNSGVYIRIPLEPVEPFMPVYYGYEVQIDAFPERWGPDDKYFTGSLYSKTYPLVRNAKPAGEWNTMEITLDGPRTIVFLNGKKVTDYKEGDPLKTLDHDKDIRHDPRPREGYIGLQNHSDEDILYFKEVAVRKLK
jgi:hypothetical protein